MESLIHFEDDEKLINQECKRHGCRIKFACETKKVFMSPYLNRLKQKTKYIEDNMALKTNIDITCPTSAVSQSYILTKMPSKQPRRIRRKGS